MGRAAANRTCEGSLNSCASSAGAGELVCLADSTEQGPPGHRLLFLALHKAPGSQINNTWPSPHTQVSGVQTLALHHGVLCAYVCVRACVMPGLAQQGGYGLGTDTHVHLQPHCLAMAYSQRAQDSSSAPREEMYNPGDRYTHPKLVYVLFRDKCPWESQVPDGASPNS